MAAPINNSAGNKLNVQYVLSHQPACRINVNGVIEAKLCCWHHNGGGWRGWLMAMASA